MIGLNEAHLKGVAFSLDISILSPRDLVSGPDKMDETVPHTPRSLVPRPGLGTTWVRQLLSGS